MTTGGQPLSETYLELRGDGSVEAIPLTREFWPDLLSGKRDIDGSLMMAFPMTEDMTHWEIHPAGDEVLIALSGRMTVVIETPAGEREIALDAGQACVVPRDHWHRLKVRDPGEVIFLTPGQGTEHKPL
jgi:mannose-6-phosphate isomerase-like protein (cupin superfamily)